MRVCEHLTGDRPPTCPWAAFRDPAVADIVNMHRAAKTGDGHHLASVLQLDPPQLVWEGIQHYHQVFSSIVGHDRELHFENQRKRSGK